MSYNLSCTFHLATLIKPAGLLLDAKSTNAGLRESDFVHTIPNGYGAAMPGRSSQLAPNMSASMDSGSMDSPSLGSDSVMINVGTNSAEARNHNLESLGDDLESPDYAGLVMSFTSQSKGENWKFAEWFQLCHHRRKKKRGPRSGPPGEKGGRGLRHFSMKGWHYLCLVICCACSIFVLSI